MSGHDSYRENHYVPQWYQRHFPSENERHHILKVLFFKPKQHIGKGGEVRFDPAEQTKPHKHCFVERDLYTTNFQGIDNTEIEQYFLQGIDNNGKRAVSAFSELEKQDNVVGNHFSNLITYLCT